MTKAELQKLALSQVIYRDLPKTVNPNRDDGTWTIKDLIKANYIKDASYDDNAVPEFSTSSPQLSALSGMLDWTLVNFQSNTSSGFAGAAFKDLSGELVFAQK